MTQQEEEAKRLADATIQNNQIVSQVGPQIAQRLKDTASSIDYLTSQINKINIENSKISKALLRVTISQVILIAFQIWLMFISFNNDEKFKNGQVAWRKTDDLNFKRLNRPKLINQGQILIGGIKYGYIPLVNNGNLPATEVQSAWSIIVIENDNAEWASPKNPRGLEENSIQQVRPTEAYNLYFYSDMPDEQRNVFLCLVYRYSGDGMEGSQYVRQYFLWNAEVSPRIWVPTPVIGNQHLRVVKNRLDELEEFMANRGSRNFKEASDAMNAPRPA